MANVFVSVCSIRAPKWQFFFSIQKAMSYAVQNGFTCILGPRIGDSLIERARHDSLAEFLDSGADYLLTLDDDVNVPYDTIPQLVSRDKDIVAGFYRLKQQDIIMAIRPITDERPTIEYYRDVFAKGECVRVRYASTGCMMVKREAVLDMVEKYPDVRYVQNLTQKQISGLYLPFIYKGELLSEDWAFCQRALDVGYEVWADGAVRLGHVGECEFRITGV